MTNKNLAVLPLGLDVDSPRLNPKVHPSVCLLTALVILGLVVLVGCGGATQTLSNTNPGATPDFAAAVSPASVSVQAGSSGSSALTTSVSGGFSGAVSLSASGQPTGVSVAFSPASIVAPGAGSSQINVSVVGAVATGSYAITIIASGGGVSHSATLTLNVTATPPAGANDFSVSASPAALSVTQGAGAAFNVSTTVSGHFSSAIALSASGQPSGVSLIVNPASIAAPGSGTAQAGVSVANSVPAGTYPITITASGGGLTHTSTLMLTVAAAPPATPDFAITANPGSLTVAQGGSGAVSVSTTVSGGFSNAIALGASGQPAGVSVSINPASIAAPGAAAAQVTFSAANSTAAGSYPITLTAVGGGLTRNTAVTLTVTTNAQADFTVTASPNVVTIPQGSSGSSTVSTSVSGGFNSALSLSVSGQPAGVTVNLNPNSVAAPGAGTAQIAISVSNSVAAGAYSITLTASGGGDSHTASLTLNVTAQPQPAPDFSVSSSPSSLSIAQGSAGSATLNTAVSGGFNNAIALSASGQPAGMTVSTNPASIAAPGSGSSQIGVSVAASVTPGSYQITLSAVGGSVVHTATLVVTVTAAPQQSADFTVTANPGTLSVTQGASGVSSVTTAISGSFNNAIALSASGLPPGASILISPGSIAAPGAGTAQVGINVGGSVATGTYPVTITAVGGTITHTTGLVLTVTAAADFSVSANPATLSVEQGSSGTSSVTTSVSGGFNNAIALSASGQPAGVTVALNPTSIAAPGSGTAQVGISVANSVAPGTYPISINAVGGGTIHTAAITLTVTNNPQAPPDFTVSANPAALSIAQGASGSSTVITAISGSFNNAIALSASGQPAGMTVSLSPASLGAPGSGTSQVSVSVGSSVATATYAVTITATGGGITHTATLNVTVTSANVNVVKSFRGCMLNQNGHRYQAVQFSVITAGTYPFNATLYYGATCNPNQWADQIGFGNPISFGGFGYTFWFIHFFDEPNTSAIWTVGNQSSQCFDYSTVPDC